MLGHDAGQSESADILRRQRFSLLLIIAIVQEYSKKYISYRFIQLSL
jgi:hypothetical protein